MKDNNEKISFKNEELLITYFFLTSIFAALLGTIFFTKNIALLIISAVLGLGGWAYSSLRLFKKFQEIVKEAVHNHKSEFLVKEQDQEKKL